MKNQTYHLFFIQWNCLCISIYPFSKLTCLLMDHELNMLKDEEVFLLAIASVELDDKTGTIILKIIVYDSRIFIRWSFY